MRSGTRSVTQVPSWIYQRYSQVWQRVVLAAGWAVLYVLVDAEIGAFPVQWRVVLAGCIFIGGLFKPVIAYVAFAAAIAYPLYLISIYVMALALAALILSAPLAARLMPLALLLVGAPVLSPVHLTPVLPLLFGLWASEDQLGGWGRLAGTVTGGLCALWLKISAGMAGAAVDLWQINGWSLSLAPIYERFHAADSLRTLILLVEPMAGPENGGASTFLLFNLLQVLAWAGAVYVVSAVRDLLLLRKQGRAGRGSAWTAILSLVPGLVVIWAGYVAVPTWLQVPGPRWLDPLWLPAQVVLAGMFALGLDGLIRYLQQPMYARQRAVSLSVPSGRPWWRARRRRATGRHAQLERALSGREGGVRPPVQVEGEQAGPGACSDVDTPQTGNGRPRAGGDDIIMIELD